MVEVCGLNIFSSSLYIHAEITIQPHLPSGPVGPNQLDESISNFRDGFFFFFRNSYKQTVKTLIRRRVPRRLIWVCTVCLSSKKGR